MGNEEAESELTPKTGYNVSCDLTGATEFQVL